MSNNPIVEIVCQITFDNHIKENWSAHYHIDLFQSIKNDFPLYDDKEKQFNLTIDFDKDKQKIQQSFSTENIMHKFSSKDSYKTIMFCEKFCAISLKVDDAYGYENWEISFYPILQDLWDKLRKIISFETIHALGIRYINKIIPEKFDIDVLDIFNTDSIFIPKIVNFQDIDNDYIFRLQLSQSKYEKLIINSLRQAQTKEFILDIDAINENITFDGNNSFADVTRKIQKRVENSFFDIISKNLSEKIKG